jgi:rod shape determining protein RodA
MYKNVSIRYALDWTTVLFYVLLVFMGWISIYGASYNFDQASIFDFSQRAGKQFIWIMTAFTLGGALLLIDSKMYNIFAWFIYVAIILLLIVTIFVAHDIKGSRSWLVLGPVSFQPAEIAKMATALALSKYMSSYNYKLRNWKDLIPLGMIIMLPFSLIVLQNETGGALVFAAFLLMLYREGMKGIVLLIGSFTILLFVIIIKLSIIPIQVNHGTLGMLLGMSIILLVQVGYAIFIGKNRNEALILLASTMVIGVIAYVLNIWFYLNYNYVAILTVVASCFYWMMIEIFNRYKKYWFLLLFSISSVLFCFSADYLFEKVLEPHQQIRIKVLLNMDDAPLGAGYNVNQSKIAIGSGGFWGKGFLNGTQTKLKYVPEQDTDFIFCTVGEEHGFWGSTLVLLVYWLLLMRILRIAERQRDQFSRIYGYCVASILFFHLTINVGMVLGIMPVIGIPLPFFSYGGSSLWGFTMLLFILLRLDAARLERMQ